VCSNATSKQYYHVCVYSNQSYRQYDRYDKYTGSYKISNVSSVCDEDPQGYQACGFNSKITENYKYLCGGYFSVVPEQVGSFVQCNEGY
jgi:hypothetical protein